MSDELRWPEERLPVEVVRDWISAALPGALPVEGPIRLYGGKEWGVTARFHTHTGTGVQAVVFKSCFLPRFRPGPLFELLSRCCPGRVPELLAWREQEGRTDALFRPFVGRTVLETGKLEPLLEMARSLAQIQAQVTAAPPAWRSGLPHLPLAAIPPLLDSMIADIQSTYAPFWEADHSALIRRFEVPDDLIPQLRRFRPRLDEWVQELQAGGWPESLDHVDFLPHNAVVQEGGAVLIYDWEQAVLTCPFFSLDILLAFAQDYPLNFPDGLEIRPERETDGLRALRSAYLQALPWGTPEARERAFDLALCLSPIRYAYIEGVMAAELGQQEAWAEDMAFWSTRALRRWQRL